MKRRRKHASFLKDEEKLNEINNSFVDELREPSVVETLCRDRIYMHIHTDTINVGVLTAVTLLNKKCKHYTNQLHKIINQLCIQFDQLSKDIFKDTQYDTAENFVKRYNQYLSGKTTLIDVFQRTLNSLINIKLFIQLHAYKKHNDAHYYLNVSDITAEELNYIKILQNTFNDPKVLKRLIKTIEDDPGLSKYLLTFLTDMNNIATLNANNNSILLSPSIYINSGFVNEVVYSLLSKYAADFLFKDSTITTTNIGGQHKGTDIIQGFNKLNKNSDIIGSISFNTSLKLKSFKLNNKLVTAIGGGFINNQLLFNGWHNTAIPLNVIETNMLTYLWLHKTWYNKRMVNNFRTNINKIILDFIVLEGILFSILGDDWNKLPVTELPMFIISNNKVVTTISVLKYINSISSTSLYTLLDYRYTKIKDAKTNNKTEYNKQRRILSKKRTTEGIKVNSYFAMYNLIYPILPPQQQLIVSASYLILLDNIRS